MEMVINLKIVFTGGGTVGHVALNLALIPYFKESEIHYIGSNGIEKDLISKLDNVNYHVIKTGKLRRYLSLDNIKDIFNVIKGYNQSKKLIKKIKPDIVFSKGGFVSVPVVMASGRYKIPIILHESDITMGLANKICKRYAKYVLTTFKDTLKSDNVINVGGIVRDSIYKGNYELGKKFVNFKNKNKVLLVVGGSTGAGIINKKVRDNLDKLSYNIIHVCGKGNLSNIKRDNYKEYEFLDNLNDIIAYSDIILSRAGANAIFEFLALKKPMLLIPLDKNQSRGDQILNANYFKNKGYALVLEESNIDEFVNKLKELEEKSNILIDNMNKQKELGSLKNIVKLINDTVGR